MDRDEALRLLGEGVAGIEEWNRRKCTGESFPDFVGVDFSAAFLNGIDFSDVLLCDSNLCGTFLNQANLREANLRNAKIDNAGLLSADLRGADLRGASLRNADIRGVDFRDAELIETNLEFSKCGLSAFVGTDLYATFGLDTVSHEGPSEIAFSTLALSKGNITPKFLRGCGLADWQIESAKLYRPDLRNDEVLDIQQRVFNLRSQGPLQVNSLFISYSHANTDFVEAIEKRFDKNGIRFWRDVHDMKAGRLEKQIDRGMRLNPTVLFIFSMDSVQSDWVEWEVSQARKLEKELKRDVLCPVALDDAWKTCDWPGPLRQQIMGYNILDFSAWQETEFFDRQFEKLVKGLDLFYRPEKKDEATARP